MPSAVEREFLKKAESIEFALRKEKAKSKKKTGEVPSEGWLVSYADMMTLLCMFFIMLFSMSTLKKPKYERMRQEVAKYFGGDFKSESDQMARFVTQMLQEQGLETLTTVKQDEKGISLTFVSTVFFETLSSEITEDGKSALKSLIDIVLERQNQELKTYKIVVEGHTDAEPIVSGSYPSNWELSAARAVRVAREFFRAGFDSSQVIPIGFSSTRPVVPHRDDWGRLDPIALKKNRRVVIRIFEPQVETVLFPEEGVSEESPRAPSADSTKLPSADSAD